MAPQNETPLDAPPQPEALDSWFLLETGEPVRLESGEPLLLEKGGESEIEAGQLAAEALPAGRGS